MQTVFASNCFGICYVKIDPKPRFLSHFSYNDECDGYYYFNTKTKVRQWEHPLDAEYKRLVERARKFGVTGVNDLSDVISCILHFVMYFSFHEFPKVWKQMKLILILSYI